VSEEALRKIGIWIALRKRLKAALADIAVLKKIWRYTESATEEKCCDQRLDD